MKGIVAAELSLLFPGSRVREFRRGSAGLHRLFEVLRELRGPGEIVVPNLCCETVALAARYAGHVVQFADVDRERFCVTAQSVRDATGPLTRAVVIVHLFGLTTEASAFREVRESHPEVVFVEDLAHAAGGCDATGFEHTMFSFSGSKILGGEGGAVVSHRDDELSRRLHETADEASDSMVDPLLALSLRNLVHSIADLHRAGEAGVSSEINPSFWDRYRSLIASAGSFQNPEKAVADLRNRETIRERRNDRAMQYHAAIRHDGFHSPVLLPGETCWRYPILAETPALRRRATEALRREGIPASNHYFPLNRLFGGEALANSEFVGDRILNLWADDSISEPQIAAAARVLNSL